jgi:acyl-CoA synthetase (NDP forming)
MPPMQIKKLLRPRSIAVVGASIRQTAIGTETVSNLLRFEFPGPIYPVNPKYEEILGLRCYPSLSQLPEVVDAVFIGIPAQPAVAVLEEAGRFGIGGAVINASGFADGGVPGRELQARLAATAEEFGIALCGPNNVGLINYHDRVCMWAAGAQPPYVPGPVALISQSGSIALSLCEDDRHLGFAYVISSGNEAVCSAADYLVDLVRDDRVRLIMLFLETIRKPALFAEAALEAARQAKRILVVKVGRSRRASRLVASHTGALAGEDEVYEAFFKQHGLIRAADLDEMVEMGKLFLAYPNPPTTPHTVPIMMSGGEAALAADLAEKAGLSVPDLSEVTAERITVGYPPYATPRNPLDAYSRNWSVGNFKVMMDALLQDPKFGVLACCVDAPVSGGADVELVLDMTSVCTQVAASTHKRIVFLNNTSGGGVNREIESKLARSGIPFLLGLTPALNAIAKWTRYRGPLCENRDADLEHPDEFCNWLAEARRTSEPERFRLVSELGVNMVECNVVSSALEAVETAERVGYPVVMKGIATDIFHKTEKGLVHMGLADAQMVAEAYAQLAGQLETVAGPNQSRAVVVQPLVKSGVELLIGVRNDADFGSLTVVGIGGTLVEVIRESSARIGPVNRQTAREMLEETRAGSLLAGFRGKGPYDIEAAIEAIVALSRFGAAAGKVLSSIEINPLLVLEQGRGVIGIDLAMEFLM